jgi:heat-inducible transcriptional repressor
MEIGDRERRILKALIDEYIETAEPVGSKILSSRLNNEMSSATIRNVMAELETWGYLEQPHTSAGRVPSTRGYRFYVDELMQVHELSPIETALMNRSLNLQIKELDRLMQETNRILSSLMKYAAFMVYPAMGSAIIHRVEIIKIDSFNHVVVIVADTGLVKNKLVRITETIDGKTFHTLLVLLNDNLRGTPLSGAEPPDIRLFVNFTGGAAELCGEVYRFIRELSYDFTEREVFFGGAANLLKYPEFSNVSRAEQALDYLSGENRGKDLAGLADEDKDITISIGTENGAESLKQTSIVMSPYRLPGSGGGLIGLVGPTRMDYAKVSAKLRYFTDGLTKLLRSAFVDDDDNME